MSYEGLFEGNSGQFRGRLSLGSSRYSLFSSKILISCCSASLTTASQFHTRAHRRYVHFIYEFLPVVNEEEEWGELSVSNFSNESRLPTATRAVLNRQPGGCTRRPIGARWELCGITPSGDRCSPLLILHSLPAYFFFNYSHLHRQDTCWPVIWLATFRTDDHKELSPFVDR